MDRRTPAPKGSGRERNLIGRLRMSARIVTTLEMLKVDASADVAVITESDLTAIVEFDEERNIQLVRPGINVFKASAKTGEGMAEYLEFLESRRNRSRAAAV